jgi:signal transduction histidine kinase
MEKKQLRSSMLKITILFWLLLTIVFGVFLFQMRVDNADQKRMDVVALNEIEQLADQPDHTSLHTAIQNLQKQLILESKHEQDGNLHVQIIALYCVSGVFLLLVFFYIQKVVIRPFRRLEDFAGQVAEGNLDIPLEYERKNIFGAFTWAFDSMRLEIKRARNAEKAAIENNKTVIATISHDIKTPIASIRAYCEALQAGLDQNSERRERYMHVIMVKCDEVSKLTNDLFLHSLSDLDKLQMNYDIYDANQLIPEILEGIVEQSERIHIIGEVPKCRINVDAKRLEQIYENLVANAMKYTQDSQIEILHKQTDECLEVTVRDYGNGIDDEDMPFLFDKFYRGANTADKQGAGLGLYIVRYILNQFDGTIALIHREDGMDARFCIKFVKE